MIEVGTQVVFASPHQIDTFMQGRSVHPKIPLLQVSGTLISANHLATYLESFEAVEDVYGTNETIKAQIIRYAYDGSAIVANLKPSDAVLQIVDTEDAPVGIGEQGQIRIQSPYMANGYLGEPKATQRHFKGGWFYPGDFGCVEADGRIKLLGRSGDVINIGGEKLLLSDLNNALLAVPSVRDGICLQNPLPNHHEELLAIVELLSTVVPKNGARECWEAMAKEFGVGLAPSKVLTVQRFPRTADGAIRRGLMRDLLTEALISGAPEQTKLFEFEISSDA
jgi:acyl-coenzyme A synthetase/AMP-(fatty) acid ligase